MKFSKLSQLFLVSSIGLLVATFFTACSIATIDIVYVASSAGSGAGSAGQIETYAVDSESGALRSVAAAVPSGGVSPVALAVTSDYENLYVANAESKTIVHFAIGMTGALTTKETVTLSSTPVFLAVNTAGTYLYVVSGTSSATLSEYALTSGALGQTAASSQSLAVPGYTGDVLVPTGITVLANNGGNIAGNAVYVTAYDQSVYNPGGSTTCTTDCANPGWVFGFTVGTGGGLTATKNSPYQAGVRPTAIASDPTDRFVYVTDYASNQLIGYTIADLGTLNILNFMTAGPFKTGNEPSAIVIDPRGKFIYVTNELDSTVSAYSINTTTGSPSAAINTSGGLTNPTETNPVAVAVDPALGRFVYTANELANSISGFVLNTTSGTLTATQASPYPTGSSPAAVIVIPHGNHSTQAINP